MRVHGLKQESEASERVSVGLIEYAKPDLLRRVVDYLVTPGNVVLLVGRTGAGKHRLAQDAVEGLSKRMVAPIELITVSTLRDPLRTIASRLGVQESAELTEPSSGTASSGEEWLADTKKAFEQLQSIASAAGENPGENSVVVLIQGVDQYPPALATLVHTIARLPRIRVIATAHGLNGAAAHLASQSSTYAVSVPPLTLEESGRYLARLLGVEHIEAHSLRAWYQLTEGNTLSVMLLALALDVEGRIGRSRGVGYEIQGPDMVPREFWQYLRESCTDEELQTLETLALAEPPGGGVLIREVDPDILSRLRQRGLMKTHNQGASGSRLKLSHKLLAAAVRDQMPPERIQDVSGKLFDLIMTDRPAENRLLAQRALVQLVTLGLAAQRPLPSHWLMEALDSPASMLEPRLRLKVAQLLMRQPDATTTQFATATLHVVWLARQCGDQDALKSVWEDVRLALVRFRRAEGSSAMLRVRLQVELARHYAFDLGDSEAGLAMLETFQRELSATSSAGVAAVQSERSVMLAATGNLRAAWLSIPEQDAVGSMTGEWERGPARVVASLLLGQRGQFTEALQVADQAAGYALLGDRPHADRASLLQFCGFINFWRCGATEAARFALEGMLQKARGESTFEGLAELAESLMGISDGTWSLSVQHAERLIDRLETYDRHGIASLAQAAYAVGLAALGEKGASRRAIRASEARNPGLAQILTGYARILTLRARQWNADDKNTVLGLKLASWAKSEGLATVELLALHAVAMDEGTGARGYLSRIRELATQVEPPLSSTVLAHCEELVSGTIAWDSPAARALTELGIWMPLPTTDELSAREREVALYASLGYSSRWIAEQFHLSVRTVDTHLRHIFTKLRISGRDELRHWFRREHQAW